MDKLVKIILLIIGLSALFLWLSKSFISCNPSDKAGEELNMDEDQGIPEEDLFEADEIDYTTTNEDDAAIPEEIVEDIEPSEKNETVDFTTPPPAQTSKPKVSTTGNYMIIAGNYLLKTNAEIMVIKLKKLGYNDASIGKFDNSKYHTVIAARYNTHEDASNTSSSLKRKGIDCYVKKKS